MQNELEHVRFNRSGLETCGALINLEKDGQNFDWRLFGGFSQKVQCDRWRPKSLSCRKAQTSFYLSVVKCFCQVCFRQEKKQTWGSVPPRRKQFVQSYKCKNKKEQKKKQKKKKRTVNKVLTHKVHIDLLIDTQINFD